MKQYQGDQLRHIAYPLGGIGAGMFCLTGSGAPASFSLRNAPDLHNNPNVFSALLIRNTGTARVLEGQVPDHLIYGGAQKDMGNGLPGKNYGLPRFPKNTFSSRFPFANLDFIDDAFPFTVKMEAFSPFIPGNGDDSSLPAASLSYTFKNVSGETIDAVYSFHAVNFMKSQPDHKVEKEEEKGLVFAKPDGFILSQPAVSADPTAKADFYAAISDPALVVNADWFVGGWFDTLTMLWNSIKAGSLKGGVNQKNRSPGGSLLLPFTLAPGEEKTVVLQLVWYAPQSALRIGYEEEKTEACCGGNCSCNTKNDSYKPWYSGKFDGVTPVMDYFTSNYPRLYEESKRFSDCLYASTLPEELMDAVTANLSILKSPTVLRQTDGRIWAWEGCFDQDGCCHGSCTHVWNYAQAMCHLFPALERSLRVTEFGENQDQRGHQEFRASIPVRKSGNSYHAASDGQLGGIMKMYREWRISGDDRWVLDYWDKMTASLDYCISIWDKKQEGVLKEPHHNTYDIEFWGADGMCSSFYLGALKAIALMGEAFGKDVSQYRELYEKGRNYLETKLFNGEYFYQQTEWKTLEATLDLSEENEQSKALLEREGPKYQYGTGCISDGVLGAWMAQVCGIGEILDPEKVRAHLLSVHKYNFKPNLLAHENPQRPGYALGDEGGLLLCSWPRGEKPSLPFVYSDEVWTGIEYQVAAHLLSFGHEKEALEIVTALRARYNGIKRNPYNEYECGHWYARAMASYALLEACTGVRYDGVTRTLYAKKGDYRVFLSTAKGYGLVTCKGDQVSFEAVQGIVPIDHISLQ